MRGPRETYGVCCRPFAVLRHLAGKTIPRSCRSVRRPVFNGRGVVAFENRVRVSTGPGEVWVLFFVSINRLLLIATALGVPTMRTARPFGFVFPVRRYWVFSTYHHHHHHHPLLFCSLHPIGRPSARTGRTATDGERAVGGTRSRRTV